MHLRHGASSAAAVHEPSTADAQQQADGQGLSSPWFTGARHVPHALLDGALPARTVERDSSFERLEPLLLLSAWASPALSTMLPFPGALEAYADCTRAAVSSSAVAAGTGCGAPFGGGGQLVQTWLTVHSMRSPCAREWLPLHSCIWEVWERGTCLRARPGTVLGEGGRGGAGLGRDVLLAHRIGQRVLPWPWHSLCTARVCAGEALACAQLPPASTVTLSAGPPETRRSRESMQPGGATSAISAAGLQESRSSLCRHKVSCPNWPSQPR